MIAFYTQLLDMTLETPEDFPYPYLQGDGFDISLQPGDDYLPPTWPTNERGQQLHLDLTVKDLPAAIAFAKSLGATESPEQYGKNWHILLDPAGHPFCLCLEPES
jgi:catechol 2,3-dioxygenase-like lactoylglutathione lyase family enzyme